MAAHPQAERAGRRRNRRPARTMKSTGHRARFTAGGPGVITFPSDEGKVFGEVQASVNFFDLNSGLSGFVRADLRFGEDLLGGSGKAGIRYTW